jgi:DNA-binding NarL/FixJ family response regulator
MARGTKTALIADDDEFFRMALRTVLTNTLGFSDVLEAETFGQATALLSENEVDLAVFDLIMPGMAGPGSLKGVRDRFPHLCLVMASISYRREDILLALQAGVNGYIPKNIGLKEFSSALAQILKGIVYVPALIATPGTVGSADEIAPAEEVGRYPYSPAKRRSLARC